MTLKASKIFRDPYWTFFEPLFREFERYRGCIDGSALVVAILDIVVLSKCK